MKLRRLVPLSLICFKFITAIKTHLNCEEIASYSEKAGYHYLIDLLEIVMLATKERFPMTHRDGIARTE